MLGIWCGHIFWGGSAIQPWHIVTKVAIMHRLKSMDLISSRLIYLFPLLNIWSVNSKDWDWALSIVSPSKRTTRHHGRKLITYNSFHRRGWSLLRVAWILSMDVFHLFTLFLLALLLRDSQSVKFTHPEPHIIQPWNKGPVSLLFACLFICF